MHNDFFTDLGEKQYKTTIVQTPERGLILDRNNTIIALNKEAYTAFLMPHKIDLATNKKLTKFLKQYYPAAYERLLQKKNKYFMYIKRKITDQEKEFIQKSGIEEIQFLKEPSRFYPYQHNATIIGITDIDNQGLFGIEMLFNKRLAGEPSTYILQKDARSGTFFFEKETTKEGKKSDTIQLTIDNDLQFIAQQEIKKIVKRFKSQEGCTVILDPTTGHVLALAHYPTFDQATLEHLDLSTTKNRCITEAYELGSVMKIIVAIAALEEGVVTPEELIDCENTKTTAINGMKFTTVHPNGIIPFSEVIEHSNNIGMAKVAMRLGPTLADYYTKLGFGKKTGIELPGEHDGFVNPPKNWSKRSIISFSFGYEMTTTIIQLAQAFATIANNGYSIRPTLLFNKQQTDNKQIISEQTIQHVKSMLRNTVEKGTAKKALVKGYDIMGKTGTAKMLINGQYSDDHNLFSFAGIVEKGDYKRVIVTFVKDAEQRRGIYAAQVTAPLFGRIAEKMLIHEKII